MSRKSINTRNSEAIIFRTENLERYLKEINVYELLTVEQERELLQQAQDGSIRAKTQLTNSNLKFVVSVAKEYQKKGVELIDLISAGNFGLMEAIEKFDLSQTCRFITYAVWRIQGKIIEFLYQSDTLITLPLNQRTEVNRLQKYKTELEEEMQCDLTYDQVLDIRSDITYSFNYVQPALQCIEEVLSLEKPQNDEGDGCNLGQMIVDTNSMEAEEQMFRVDQKMLILSALEKIPTIQKQVLTLCFGLDDGIVRTNEDIASCLNKSSERVRQIKKKGLENLKKNEELSKIV